MVLVKLFSDNFNGELMSVKAYEQVALQMSTGDFAMHKAELVVCPSSHHLPHYCWDKDTQELVWFFY